MRIALLFCTLLLSFASFANAQGDVATAPRPLDVQALIDEAVREKRPLLHLPAGKWRVSTDVIRIEGARDFTFDGNGSTLVFGQFTRYAVGVNNSHGVTLRDFSVDYDPLPFTQGTVVVVTPEKRQIEVELHAGYPDFTPTHAVKHAMVFEAKTRGFKANTPDLYYQIEVLNPRRARLTMNANVGTDALAVGDLVAFNVRTSGALALT